jgi:hypothetical protein
VECLPGASGPSPIGSGRPVARMRKLYLGVISRNPLPPITCDGVRLRVCASAHLRVSLANTGVGSARSRQTGTPLTLYTSRQKLPNDIMSAHDDETVRRAMLHGAIGFLHKHCVEDVLLDSILLATGRKGEVN